MVVCYGQEVSCRERAERSREVQVDRVDVHFVIDHDRHAVAVEPFNCLARASLLHADPLVCLVSGIEEDMRAQLVLRFRLAVAHTAQE